MTSSKKISAGSYSKLVALLRKEMEHAVKVIKYQNVLTYWSYGRYMIIFFHEWRSIRWYWKVL